MFDKTGSRQIDFESFCQVMRYLNKWLECYRSHDNAANKKVLHRRVEKLKIQIARCDEDLPWKEKKQKRVISEIDDLEKLLAKKRKEKQNLDAEINEVHAKRRALEKNVEDLKNSFAI